MSRYFSNTRNVTGILAIALVLTACSGLTHSDKPAVSVWWLQPVTGAPQADAAAARAPLILELGVVPGLDSDRVLALSTDAQLKPYAGARWTDDLPELVASLLERSLQATGRFDVAQSRARSVASSCELQLELTEFFANLDSSGRTQGVSVGIGGTYRCPKAETREIESHADVRVDEEQMTGIVAAFQKALDRVLLDIINKI